MTGGTLEAKRMTINFLQGKPRYSNQFDIHASNITFTQDDLFESSCIRNGLARLLVRILSNAGLFSSDIQVTAVDIVVCCIAVVSLPFLQATRCSHMSSFSDTAVWQDFHHRPCQNWLWYHGAL
jgi:hypothetical protein